MSDLHTFSSALRWVRTTADFTYDRYDRSHSVVTGSGVVLPSSAAPAFRGSPSRANPEEMLLAALSSCHMLTFLAIAARKRFIINSYSDDAVAFMEKNGAGKLSVTRATLRPHIVFSAEKIPTALDVEHTHKKAHEECFIANSVTTVIVVEGTFTHAP
jgi:organic hydroperoxide reductase OsmC/OhrA